MVLNLNRAVVVEKCFADFHIEHIRLLYLCRTYPIHLADRAGQPEKFRPVIRFFKSSQRRYGCKTIHTKVNSVGASKHTDSQATVANDNKTRPAGMPTKPRALMRREVNLADAAFLRL